MSDRASKSSIPTEDLTRGNPSAGEGGQQEQRTATVEKKGVDTESSKKKQKGKTTAKKTKVS